jgi:hypothetical protein
MLCVCEDAAGCFLSLFVRDCYSMQLLVASRAETTLQP